MAVGSRNQRNLRRKLHCMWHARAAPAQLWQLGCYGRGAEDGGLSEEGVQEGVESSGLPRIGPPAVSVVSLAMFFNFLILNLLDYYAVQYSDGSVCMAKPTREAARTVLSDGVLNPFGF